MEEKEESPLQGFEKRGSKTQISSEEEREEIARNEERKKPLILGGREVAASFVAAKKLPLASGGENLLEYSPGNLRMRFG